jgi:cysteinyl-tRNA synthetase
MAQRLYNTLSRRLIDFTPADPTRVLFYTCGPTVYDYAHIGNFRAFLVADVLRRWLESPLCEVHRADGSTHDGPRRVVHVMNITDVGHMTEDDLLDGGGEDKMEAAASRLAEAKKSGKLPAGAEIDPSDPYAIADFYMGEFIDDARALGVKVAQESINDASLLPRASEHVRQMLEIIVKLMEKDCAYQTPDGAVYFSTESFGDYGALSGNTLDALRTGAGGRVSAENQSAKRHPADFLLWKADAKHLMRWDPSKMLGRKVSLAEGYPGWHIECSAMALERLGPDDGIIDLHSGGEDNIFPHHECEIAQSRCFTGAELFARCWVHTRFLLVESEKMSKSKGNFYTFRDLVKAGFSPAAIRLEIIKTHYRSNANFTEQGLRDSQRMIDRWTRFLDAGEISGAEGRVDETVLHDFRHAMHDDLNTAGAIGAINAWINRTESPTVDDATALRRFDAALGVLSLDASAPAAGDDDPEAARIDALVAARTAARQAKDWAEADRIRDELASMGVEITDGPGGTTWGRKASL